MYRVYPAKIAPLLCGATAVLVAIAWWPWALSALPFIYLGSICAAPNFNLADGCLVFISVALGAGVVLLNAEVGVAIIAGSAISWVISCIEKAITAKEIKDEH
jgi:hypothetical protein